VISGDSEFGGLVSYFSSQQEDDFDTWWSLVCHPPTLLFFTQLSPFLLDCHLHLYNYFRILPSFSFEFNLKMAVTSIYADTPNRYYIIL
jgi:hypothetical protein